ncbi:MAG: ECF-type sigma factor [Acidobacteriota bacterium]|nr:ECF-type sigma factor [Acidobacteriota bacterium]
MDLSGEDVTSLLQAALNGSKEINERDLQTIVDALRGAAAGLLRSEKDPSLLQPTALVNEAWLRLAGSDNLRLKSRLHFAALATKVMRRVLVDHARARQAKKRGSGGIKVSLDKAGPEKGSMFDLIALEDELKLLEKLNKRQGLICEMRYFGGLNGDEIARVLDISPALVSRELNKARGWLASRLSRGDA